MRQQPIEPWEIVHSLLLWMADDPSTKEIRQDLLKAADTAWVYRCIKQSKRVK